MSFRQRVLTVAIPASITLSARSWEFLIRPKEFSSMESVAQVD